MQSTDWIDLAGDRDRWRAVVNAVMKLRAPLRGGGGGFLDWLKTGWLLKKDSAAWSKYCRSIQLIERRPLSF